MSAGYMLDTTVFDWVVRGSFEAETLAGRGALCVTHIQMGELLATPSLDKRERLLQLFHQVNPSSVPTESAVWDMSTWDECKWASDDGLHERMLVDLDNRRRDANNPKDILIAETALRLGLALVTDDRRLCEIFQQYGGQALQLSEFLELPTRPSQ